MQLKPIERQVVVVMGASSGIGRAAALRFARRGAKIVAAARSREGLRTLVDGIRHDGGEAMAVPADTADFDQVREVAETAADVFGRIDTWVHTAGTSVYATFEQTTPEEFKRVVDVNLTGQAYGAMAALPHLRRAGGGALVHVSSVEAKFSMPYQSAYAASKHGIEGFLDALRLELAHEGVPISVTSIMPGPVNTPFFDKVRTKIGVEPTVPPPVYHPSVVADAILHAAEHPTRRVVVGGAAAVGAMLNSVAPRVMDAILLRTGFGTQKMDGPKSPAAPDSLFEPIEGHDVVEGTLPFPARETSISTTLQTSTPAKLGVAAAAAAIALIAYARAK
jgi:NAD(P)-dependent dehydrogenase (short-subunit alcohol dehydrogenase family)